MKVIHLTLMLMVFLSAQIVSIAEERILVRVLSDTTFSGRNLTATSLELNQLPAVFEIHASIRTPIEKHGEKISVHEIRNGDILQIQGNYSAGRLFASEIMVNEHSPSWLIYDRERDYRAVQGIVGEINSSELWFTLETDTQQYRIFAERARILDSCLTLNLVDINRGTYVLVRGNLNDFNVDAERIEVNRLIF